MPVILDNNFAKDTYGIRTERLIAIQGNFSTVQPDLQAPAHIESWADDCFDIYSNLLAVSGLEMSESETATAIVAEKVDELLEAYQNVRYIGTSIYSDNQNIINEYGFNEAFPEKRDDMFRRIDKVLLAYSKHTSESLTPLIPSSLISRLTLVRDNLQTAIANQDKERFEARRAVTDASERFVSDTKILIELKSWAYVMFGKQDDRLTLIGMVNPKSGGGAPPIPVPEAPTNLIYNPAVPSISWDIVVGATSYEVQHKDDTDTEWNIIYTGVDNNLLHADPLGEYNVRLRSRNAGGFSEFSNVLNYTVLPPQPD